MLAGEELNFDSAFVAWQKVIVGMSFVLCAMFDMDSVCASELN